MTEDEAKRKRCCGPEGCGISVPSRTPGPEDDGDPWLRMCCGSACMAWRVRTESVRLTDDEQPKGDGWLKDGQSYEHGGYGVLMQAWTRDVFYCGYAGAPTP